MARHSPADDAQFQSNCGSSVISNRNHGLLRGVSINDTLTVLKTYSKFKRAISPSKKETSELDANDLASSDKNKSLSDDEDDQVVDVKIKSFISDGSSVKQQKTLTGRQNTVPPVNFPSLGQAANFDNSKATWDWPLGNPTIKNGEDRFEVKLKISPFKAEEVSVYLTGNELIVHCAKTHSSGNSFNQIFRAYTLPLNVNPKSAEFTMTRSGYVRISIQKEQPLKMAVAFAEPTIPVSLNKSKSSA